MIAPAKINLALHVTGQRADGYHLLESLTVFTRDGDRLSVRACEQDEIIVSGHFAAQVPIDGNNLVAHARDLLRQRFGAAASQPVCIKLEKNLPVASGIGGGSSDAAAAMRLLVRYWGLEADEDTLAATGLEIGADVPMCLAAKPLVARGIGDKLDRLARFPALPLVLLNPGIPLSTVEVYSALSTKENPPLPSLPENEAIKELTDWLAGTRNDLQAAAAALEPQIDQSLNALRETGALFVRMSGSGATCFGIFSSSLAAQTAAKTLSEQHPEWFVLATTSNAETDAHHG